MTGEAETYQTTTKEHDGNRHMFEILRRPCTTPGGKMLEKDVGTPIEADDEGFDELGRREGRFPLAHLTAGRLDVPCPPKVGKATHPTSKSEQSVPEEDSAFDKMGKPIENIGTSLFTVSGLRLTQLRPLRSWMARLTNMPA